MLIFICVAGKYEMDLKGLVVTYFRFTNKGAFFVAVCGEPTWIFKFQAKTSSFGFSTFPVGVSHVLNLNSNNEWFKTLSMK